MFYNNLKNACTNKRISITALLKKLGISSANGTFWKNGSLPNGDSLIQLSKFLDVSTDYLLFGEEQYSSKENLSEDQQRLLKMYSLLSDMEKGEILGELKVITKGRTITKEDNDSNIHTAYVAARSFDNHPPEIVTGDFSEILNAPDVTDKY